MKIGLIYSRVRFEEKQIIEALNKRGIAHDLIDDREIVFNLTPQFDGHPEKHHGVQFVRPEKFQPYDVVLDRAMEFTRGLYALEILNSWGVHTVNRASVVALCGDKLLTTAALSKHNVASPRTEIAFTPEAALEAVENMGYPVVVKPVSGAWGRLVAQVNDRAAATVCPLVAALEKIALDAAHAVGGGFLAIDVIEDPDRGYLVNEINPTPEFRGSETATGADIPNKLIDYLIQVAGK
jgi:glutathione synthase/RimK-type ligase-like ATP-grasp enzyme